MVMIRRGRPFCSNNGADRLTRPLGQRLTKVAEVVKNEELAAPLASRVRPRTPDVAACSDDGLVRLRVFIIAEVRWPAARITERKQR